MKTEIVIAGAVALAGIMLLGGKTDGGGAGGGTGAGEQIEEALESAGVTINIPDFSFPSGDMEDPKKEYADAGVEYFSWLKQIGDLPTIGEQGDIMARSEFDISDYRTTTQKTKAFTLPFLGATGASSFGDYIKTHNIYGKLIPKAASSKPSSGISAAVRKYRYPTFDLRTGKKTTVDAFTGVSPTKGYVGTPR